MPSMLLHTKFAVHTNERRAPGLCVTWSRVVAISYAVRCNMQVIQLCYRSSVCKADVP